MNPRSLVARLSASDFVRHGMLVFGGTVVAALFNYLYYMLTGRFGGVVVYGIVASLASAMLVVATPALVGQLIAARLAADLASRGDRPALAQLADMLTAWTASIAAIVVAAGLLARDLLAHFFNLTDSTPVVIVTIALGIYALVAVQRGLLQGAQHFGDYSASTSIESVVKVLIGIPLVVVLGASGGLLGILVGVLLAFAFDVIVFRARFGAERSPIALDRSAIVRVVSHVGLGQLTFTILTFYDVPLMKHAFDPHAAGLYSSAALVGRAVLSAVSFIPTLVMPKATARMASGRSPLPLLGVALGLAGGIVLVAALFAGFAPRWTVSVIAGRAFGDAAPLVLPYTIASAALSLGNVVAAYQIGLHRYGFVVPAILAALAEIVVLTLWHPSLGAAVNVLVAGHGCVLAITLASTFASPLASGRAGHRTQGNQESLAD